MSKEAMKLALEALNNSQAKEPIWKTPIKDAIKALEEALAKQEQGEPVGTAGELFTNTALERLDFKPSTKIYTTPQQRKPLTTEQIWEAVKDLGEDSSWRHIVDAIEAAHGIKEKNT
jgi:hypothetical protein